MQVSGRNVYIKSLGKCADVSQMRRQQQKGDDELSRRAAPVKRSNGGLADGKTASVNRRWRRQKVSFRFSVRNLRKIPNYILNVD